LKGSKKECSSFSLEFQGEHFFFFKSFLQLEIPEEKLFSQKILLACWKFKETNHFFEKKKEILLAGWKSKENFFRL